MISDEVFLVDEEVDAHRPADKAGSGRDEGTGCPQPVKDAISASLASIEAEDDEDGVCPVCLECFTTGDPAMETSCGHTFHLQCIMQWAQRSHECPMCFRSLELKDRSMNELLPFGEFERRSMYGSPSGASERWELERALARLAIGGRGGRRRDHREGRASRARAAAASLLPIARRAALAPRAGTDAGSRVSPAASLASSRASSTPPLTPTRAGTVPGEGHVSTPPAPSRLGSAAAAGPANDRGHAIADIAHLAGFPASWPPAGARMARGAGGGGARGGPGGGDGGPAAGGPGEPAGASTPGPYPAYAGSGGSFSDGSYVGSTGTSFVSPPSTSPLSFKQRFQGMKLKDTFSKATKELRSVLFSPTRQGDAGRVL